MMKKRFKIIVDAMGGDFAPGTVVDGAVDACRDLGVDIILVGNQSAIQSRLKYLNATYLPINIRHASEVITMADNPLQAVKKKKDSSIRIGMEMLKHEQGDVFISAGNSGAVVSAALLILKRLKGIDRPAIAPIMPTLNGHVIVADAGANNTCKPFNLVQFALMCSIHGKYSLNCDSPKVGILSNGEEEIKGTELIKLSHSLLKESTLNYIGYVEGKDIFNGVADIVICDGFTGNVLLKVAEGVTDVFATALKEEITDDMISKIGYLFSKRSLSRLKTRFDYSEYGAAPLLGVNGSVLIGHGRSTSRAIKHSIRAAREFAEKEVMNHMANDLAVNKDLHSIGKKPSFINKVLKDMPFRKAE